MQALQKSNTSVRQLLRNPSGRVIAVLILIIVIVVLAIFGRGEWDTISENFSKRPKLIMPTAGPPPHRWSDEQAYEFFMEYAMAQPPPEGLKTAGVQTCWDYVVSLSVDPPQPAKAVSTGNSSNNPASAHGPGVPAFDVPRWTLLSGNSSWQFWENTRSVVGPC